MIVLLFTRRLYGISMPLYLVKQIYCCLLYDKSEFKGFAMDVKCFFGTIVRVLKSDGFVEGGTGEMKKQEEENIEQKVTTK